jgi:protein ImuB
LSEHTFVLLMTVGCLLIPRFSLIAAIGDRKEVLAGPAALAPEPGGEQLIGEVSGAAEAFGVRPGAALSEALARCPRLLLVPPDPGRAESIWERSLRRLEGIGAEVEPARPGEVFFGVGSLLRLWGPRPEGVLSKAAGSIGPPARAGGGPTRFCSFAAANAARGRRRRPLVVPPAMARSFLQPLPVGLLRGRLRGADREAERLVESLERLGVTTLGDLAGLPRSAIADRFGRLGLRARDLASGVDSALHPRHPHEELLQALQLPEAAYGTQLGRALELLIERLVADPRRRGRTIRSLRLEAQLAGGGSWRVQVTMRSASASAERLRLALGPRLEALPAPAATLVLRAVEMGAEVAEQPTLGDDESERRREQLSEAVRQARAAGGRDALLRVVDVEPDSRIPERRAMLVPHTP